MVKCRRLPQIIIKYSLRRAIIVWGKLDQTVFLSIKFSCRSAAASDETVGEARMYARSGDPMYPVRSYKRYLSKVHPKLDDLWQRPLDSYDYSPPSWYCRIPLGKNTLSSMITDISKLENYQEYIQITLLVQLQ